MIVAQRDILAVFNPLKEDIDQLLKRYADGKIDPREAEEMKFRIQKMKTNLDRAQKYVLENIEEISN